jgi:hypothetical protein
MLHSHLPLGRQRGDLLLCAAAHRADNRQYRSCCVDTCVATLATQRQVTVVDVDIRQLFRQPAWPDAADWLGLTDINIHHRHLPLGRQRGDLLLCAAAHRADNRQYRLQRTGWDKPQRRYVRDDIR